MERWRAKLPLEQLQEWLTHAQKRGSRRGAVHIFGKPNKKSQNHIKKHKNASVEKTQTNV